MNLFEQLLEAYPELTEKDFSNKGFIILQDDNDGVGAFIAKWEYSKPIPDGLKLGKPKS